MIGVDPGEILKRHLKDLVLSDQERADIEATFHRLVVLGGEAAAGANVTADMRQIEAQLALWKSGALSATQAAVRGAALEYAEAAGELLARLIKGAVGGLL